METEKLYSPVNIFIRDNQAVSEGRYRDGEWREPMAHQEAIRYMDEIKSEVLRGRGVLDKSRGLAAYISDSLDDVVHSVFPDIELHGDRLWFVADMRLTRPVTPGEMGELTQWWEYQLYEGWGDGFKQDDIVVDRGSINIEPWASDKSFFIDTATEFQQRIGINIPSAENTTTCRNVELKRGDMVLSLDNSDYNLLVGEVLSIEKSGSPEHSTDNPWDDIHVDFNVFDYYDDRVSEIEEAFSKLNGCAMEFDECPLDDVIMAPNMLIGIQEISREDLDEVLDSAKKAAAYCDRILGNTKETADTLAQAALHEPDIYGDEVTATLREQLISRLDGNLSAYFNDICGKDELNIPSMSSEIAAVMGAHYYLTEKHNFHKSELEYLLQFKNPLEVVADQFELEADIEDHSAVMWDILDKQDALQGDYERVMSGGEAQETMLSDRLDENFTDFKKEYMEMGKADIFANADEIASVTQAYQYFCEEHNYMPEQVDHLLQFENPLEVVSDRWAGSLRDISPIVNDIFNERNRESALLCYTLADPLAGHEPTCGETDGKPSVLAQIRRAREDARENPAPRNSTPGKDHEPEL